MRSVPGVVAIGSARAGHLHPDRPAVDAPQAEQVGLHVAIAPELLQQIRARLLVDEAVGRRAGVISDSGTSAVQPNISRRCGLAASVAFASVVRRPM